MLQTCRNKLLHSFCRHLGVVAAVVTANVGCTRNGKLLNFQSTPTLITLLLYRPISILPVFSKFYEKVIYDRLISFINRHNLLCAHQYGFRSNYSTSMATTQLANQISTSTDKKEVSLGIFLDLSKAFDTVNHKILLQKLENYGIRRIALSWITSYLNNRKQFVQFNNVNSSENIMKCGIPQGSILVHYYSFCTQMTYQMLQTYYGLYCLPMTPMFITLERILVMSIMFLIKRWKRLVIG